MAVSEKNLCTFYASDYHLEMIMLPYINRNLEKNKNVYVFTQNNLEPTINTVIDRVNIENKTKEKMLNINWKIDDKGKYERLIEDRSETIIFIKGNEEYIEKVNKNLEQIREYKKMEVVDCYDISEVENKINNIVDNHKTILTTIGKK